MPVVVALAAAAGAGAVYATHTFTNADNNVLACINHNRGVIRVLVDPTDACKPDREVPVELALRGGRVANADNAANADTLDGIDSTGFLTSDTKVADADKLDGIDSTGFLRSDIYEKSVHTYGVAEGSGDISNAQLKCDAGDRLLSGGFGALDPGTHILRANPYLASSALNNLDTYVVRWLNDASKDEIHIVIQCVNQ